MEVIYGLLPAILIAGLAMVGVLMWAVRSGQYDDMEGPAHRILMDDDDPLLPKDGKAEPRATPDKKEGDSKAPPGFD